MTGVMLWAGVMLWDRINNDVVRLRTGMVRKLEDRVDARVSRWFGAYAEDG